MHGGCRRGMPVRQDDRPGTGCRADCLHRYSVQDYRLARHAQQAQLEQVTALYPAEVAEWKATHPMITFRGWLEGHRRPEERPDEPTRL